MLFKCQELITKYDESAMRRVSAPFHWICNKSFPLKLQQKLVFISLSAELKEEYTILEILVAWSFCILRGNIPILPSGILDFCKQKLWPLLRNQQTIWHMLACLGEQFLSSEQEQEQEHGENETVKTKKAPLREGPKYLQNGVPCTPLIPPGH